MACSCGVLECTAEEEHDKTDKDKGEDAPEEAAGGNSNDYEVAVDMAQASPWGTKISEDGARREVDVEMAAVGVCKST